MSITLPSAMSEPPRRCEVSTGTGGRRSSTAAEEALIVAESYGGEGPDCGVARRHGLSSSRLFMWLRLARPRRSCEPGAPLLFVPAVGSSEPEVAANPAALMPPKPRKRRRRSEGARIELEIDGVVARGCRRRRDRDGNRLRGRGGVLLWPTGPRISAKARAASPCWCENSRAPTRSAARCSPSARILRQVQDEGADRLKLLFFGGTDVVLVARRLEASAFRWPKPGDGALQLTAAEMAALVDGLDSRRVHGPRDIAVPRLTGQARTGDGVARGARICSSRQAERARTLRRSRRPAGHAGDRAG